MKYVNKTGWWSQPDDELMYEVLVDGSETGLWAFQTNKRLSNPVTTDILPMSENDVHTTVCLYRVYTDDIGMFRLHGTTARSTNASGMRNLARKIFPNITKSSWRTNKNTVRLTEEEDKMLYQLTYGGAHVT